MTTVRDAVRGMLSLRFPARTFHPSLAPHQRAAVSRILEILERHPAAVLADAAGLGKSYVAADVARHYRARGDPVSFFAPAMLLPMWRSVLRTFDLDVNLQSHDSIRRMDRDPGDAEGLVIVDEAHRFRNRATLRYAALAQAVIGRRVLLVTATPVCNRLDDLLAILQLGMSNSALTTSGVPSIRDAFRARDRTRLQLILAEIVVRRGYDCALESLRIPTLRRTVIPVEADEPFMVTLEAIGELRFPGIARHNADRQLMRRILIRRFDSSPAALLESVRRLRRFSLRAIDACLKGLTLTTHDYRAIFAGDGELPATQELLFPEFWFRADARSADRETELRQELPRLDALILQLQLTKDPKFDRLIDLVTREASDGILVFTGAIATATSLYRQLEPLTRAGLVTSRRARLRGFDRLRPSDLFTLFDRREFDVMICTDLASEGLNLQSAGVVVHYDLPWNPVKLEQRNGRICRIGQARESVRAIYFLPRRRRDPLDLVGLIGRKRRAARDVEGSRVSTDAWQMILDEAALCSQSLTNRCCHVSVAAHPGCDALVLVKEGSGLRLLSFIDGGLVDSAETVRRALEGVVETMVIEGGCGVDKDRISAALADRSDALRTRISLPPEMESSSPQRRLATTLDVGGLLDGRLRDLLARRYRSGVEMVLSRFAAEDLDRTKVDHIESLLAREVSLENIATRCDCEFVAALIVCTPLPAGEGQG